MKLSARYCPGMAVWVKGQGDTVAGVISHVGRKRLDILTAFGQLLQGVSAEAIEPRRSDDSRSFIPKDQVAS